MKRLTLLLTCLMLSMGLAIAQTTQVKGIVLDESNEPIAGASVIVKGNASVGTVTNVNGLFTLDVPSSSKTLIVRYLGMRDQEVAVGTDIRVVLKISESVLDEVIVVAYGSVKKASFTGSAGVISADKLEKRTVSNVTKAIEGTIPGVLTTSGSGQPGSGADIRIRGIGSINSDSSPLYVVDGAPFAGTLSSINPNDIESVTVLKDASAGALYGSRGANGVVMITTKKGAGNDGRTRVSLKANWGVQSRALPRYDLMNESEWITTNFHMFRNRSIFTDALPADKAGQQALINMVSGANRLFGANEQYNPYNMPISQLVDPVTGAINPDASLRYHQDWMDESTAENPLVQEYNLSLSGGSAKNQYYLSLGYVDQEGILVNTSFQRITGRLSMDSQATDWLKMGGALGIGFNESDSKLSESANVTNIWYAAQKMAPIYPVYKVDASGVIILDEFGNPTYDLGSTRASGGTPNYNCVGQLYADKFYSNSDNLDGHTYAEAVLRDEKYGWARGLGFKLDLNINLYNSRGTTYYDQNWGSGITSGGSLTKTSSRIINYTMGEFLTYNRTFGEHNIDFLAGHEYMDTKINELSGTKSKFPFPGLYELNPGSVLDGVSSTENELRIESYLSRARYSYADKYNVDASIRTDGSSRFYKDSRWGTFWSLGANWRISQESFMTGYDWLNNLSLRASYGEQGNDRVGSGSYYAWQSLYSLSMPNANNNGSVISSLESKNLSWEKHGNFNTGIDVRLFNRVNLTVEYYNRNITDMLLAVPMATSLGWDSYNANVGSMYNRGIEISLDLDVVKTDNFDWRFNILATSNKNKITKLATDKPIIGSQIIKVGESVYTWYLPKSAGVDPATGKQLYWVWDEKDQVTDERISEPYISSDASKAGNSRELCGTRAADVYGAIGSDFTFFKNFHLSVMTTYSLGGKTLDSFYNGLMHPGYLGENIHRHALRAWKNPGDITDIPRLELNGTYATTQDELIDASYFSIKNISLGYDLPRSLTKKAGLDMVRFTVTGDNLFMFCNLNGMDPQSSFSATSTYAYTPTRAISFGININF